MNRVAVWGRTQEGARESGLALGIPVPRLTALGNRSADAVRGLTVDAVIVLPGADAPEVERNLRTAQQSVTGPQWLDLRGVR